MLEIQGGRRIIDAMKEDDAVAVIEAYDALVDLALARAAEWRGWGLYFNAETAKVCVSDDGQLVVQAWRAGSDGYDGYELEEESFVMPLAFALASEDERAAIIAERKRIEERDRRIQEAADRDRAEREREAQDRAEFERLKAKFA